MENSNNLKPTLKIITISGAANSGKTTLIQKVFQKLVSDDGEITYYEACGKRLDDFLAVIVWHGKIITFCSIGDKPEENENDLKNIESGIELAEGHDADILVNARTDDISETEYIDCLKEHFGSKPYQPIRLEEHNSLETLIKDQQLKFGLIMGKL